MSKATGVLVFYLDEVDTEDLMHKVDKALSNIPGVSVKLIGELSEGSCEIDSGNKAIYSITEARDPGAPIGVRHGPTSLRIIGKLKQYEDHVVYTNNYVPDNRVLVKDLMAGDEAGAVLGGDDNG